mmetsp:Transcript_20548/g.15149  ORF Transcript_20548/g.15149 Transcript_20548/m.15149 type:complete len:97 (-) Transcript_20548:331-621(-)
MWYTLKLILGITCIVMSLNMIAIVALDLVDAYISSVNMTYLNEFVDQLVTNGTTYVAAVIFLLISGYMLVVAVKGNATIGYRFAFFTFYPVTENET